MLPSGEYARIGAYESGYGPGGFSVRQTLQTIWRFRAFVLAAVLVAVGISLYNSKVRRPEFRAGSVIHIKADQNNPLAGMSGGAVARMFSGAPSGGLRSQVELMRSMAVLTEVVDELGLRLMERKEGLIWDQYYPAVVVQNPQVGPEPEISRLELQFEADEVIIRTALGERRARYGQPVAIGGVGFTVPARPSVEAAELLVFSRYDAAGHLARSLGIGIRTDTNILDVTYTAYDPYLAQRVVNSAVQSFHDYNNRRIREDARVRSQFIGQQIEYTDSLLDAAQLELIEFQQRVKAQTASGRFEATQAVLVDLELRLAEMQSEKQMYEAILTELRTPREPGDENRIRLLSSDPLMGENSVFVSLVERLMSYESTRDGMTVGQWGSAQSNPEVARLDALIRATEERLTEALVRYVQGLDARIAAAEELHERRAQSMQSLPAADAEEVRLEHDIEAISEVLSFLQQAYHTARLDESVASGGVEIVDLARPGDILGHDPIRTVAFGIIFGLMFGSGGALLLANFRTSIRQRDEVEQVLNINRLAVIPSFQAQPVSGRRFLHRIQIQNGRNGASSLPVPSRKDLVVAHGGSAGAEAFRALRANLIFGRGFGRLRTIAVTSAAPSEGRSTTVANLGLALAQQGVRVLLVDCDLRRPELHKMFGVPGEPGLAELIVGAAAPEDVVHASESAGLSVVPAGTFSPRASHLLGTARVAEAIEKVSAEFDVVLLDTPPLQVTVDSAVIAAHADGTVFLVRAGKTDRRMAQSALEQLKAVGANVLGGVLNDAAEKSAFPQAYSDTPEWAS